MTRKPDIRSLDREQLVELCTRLGWESYRADQLLCWLWQKNVDSFDSMTNLAKDKRQMLADRFCISDLEVRSAVTDAGGTTKFTFELDGGAVVESVFIPEANRRTVCVSTQAGCQLGCRFCYTARIGFVRNLFWHEIVLQVLAVQRHSSARLTNVVLMGMGEPLLNYEAVTTAIRTINSDHGINVGARRITLSTAGIPDRIRELAGFPLQAKLAISLNAADDETRSRIMPVNHRHPIPELLSAVSEFTRVRRKRVTFEYVLIKGVNDRREDSERLPRLLKGIPCKVNLIPLNPFPGCDLAPPSSDSVERFAERLYPRMPAVTIRRSRGGDILAGCGQLAGARRPVPDNF